MASKTGGGVKAGDTLFFEGARYEVTGLNTRGHFEAVGKRGD